MAQERNDEQKNTIIDTIKQHWKLAVWISVVTILVLLNGYIILFDRPAVKAESYAAGEVAGREEIINRNSQKGVITRMWDAANKNY